MKKVFWGILLSMSNLEIILTIVLTLIHGTQYSSLIYAGAGLIVSLGYLFIMLGARSLPGSYFLYATKISTVLCAYSVAAFILTYFNVMPGGTIGSILGWISSLGSFITMYFCVLGVGDLERGSSYLGADKLRTAFSVWVILNLLSSFIFYLAIAGFAAYVIILFYFGKSAHNYKGGGGWRVY